MTPEPYFLEIANRLYGGDVEKAIRALAEALVVALKLGRKVPELGVFQVIWNEMEETRVAARKRQKIKRERRIQERIQERLQRDEMDSIPADFDQSQLLKDGTNFVGVHTHGAGYRAYVKSGDGKGGRYLQTRKTAERAAYDRFLHHRENRIPYTPWEVFVCEGHENMDAFAANETTKWVIACMMGRWDIMPEQPPPDVEWHSPQHFAPRDVLRGTLRPVEVDAQMEGEIARIKEKLSDRGRA